MFSMYQAFLLLQTEGPQGHNIWGIPYTTWESETEIESLG